MSTTQMIEAEARKRLGLRKTSDIYNLAKNDAEKVMDVISEIRRDWDLPRIGNGRA